MEIKPVMADSLGVRSLATLVETKDIKIFIDPSAALAPKRYGLPPHAFEIERMEKAWKDILEISEEVDAMIITHYHFDHFSLDKPEQFKNKILFIKDPLKNINYSQKRRAYVFKQKIKNFPKKIEVADSKNFKFGKTTINFSPPVWHGEINSKVGFVVMASIKEEEKFMFCSDIEGPISSQTADYIIKENPDMIAMSGPITYMLGYWITKEQLKQAEKNFLNILKKTNVQKIILDHHLLRDLNYRKNFKVYEAAENFGKRVLTVAEFLKKEIEQLEAKRKELYSKYKTEPIKSIEN